MNSKTSAATAIAAKNLTKIYKLYGNVTDQAIDILGLKKLFFWHKIEPTDFPALKGINFNILHGERVGIIGQNGAGKTTLLKLITGAISHSDGTLEVNGDIQALMQVGLGFHPEFTGRENIEASLLYSGLSPSEKKEAEEDIIDFCELGQFLDQPLKTYSLGMQARLQFACATAIKPDILIVDEILGAGDAYFSMKSSARMEKLTQSGCTLLLVSHSMGQVLQFCQRVIWIGDGVVKKDGLALDVVKAYEQWMHEKSLGAGLLNVSVREEDIADADEQAPPVENEVALSDKGAAISDTADDIVAPADKKSATEAPPRATTNIDPTSRWKSDNAELLIHDILIRDEKGQLNKIFNPDTNMTIEVQIEAKLSGSFSCAAVIHIMSEDGRSVIWSGSPTYELEVDKNEIVSVRLSFAPLMLNAGRYTVASALFDKINPLNKGSAYRYDLISRGYGFAVTDVYDGNDSLFRHPAKWDQPEKN